MSIIYEIGHKIFSKTAKKKKKKIDFARYVKIVAILSFLARFFHCSIATWRYYEILYTIVKRISWQSIWSNMSIIWLSHPPTTWTWYHNSDTGNEAWLCMQRIIHAILYARDCNRMQCVTGKQAELVIGRDRTCEPVSYAASNSAQKARFWTNDAEFTFVYIPMQSSSHAFFSSACVIIYS